MGRKNTHTPPHSLDAEQAVIGSLILAPERFAELATTLSPIDAYDVRHQTVLTELFAMHSASVPLDVTLLVERLQASDRLEAAGGIDYIGQCVQSVPSDSRLSQYAEVVATKARQRRLIEAGHELIRLGKDDHLALTGQDDWLTTAEGLFRHAIDRRPRRGMLGPAPVMTCLADVQPEEVQWLWPERIALGKLTMLVGDPGLGKSFVSIDLATRVSRGLHWPDSPSTPAPLAAWLCSRPRMTWRTRCDRDLIVMGQTCGGSWLCKVYATGAMRNGLSI